MIIHVVKAGDTVYNLALEYHTTPLKIIEDNQLKDPNNLVIGQTLVILNNNENKNQLESIDVFGYTYTHVKKNILNSALEHLSAVDIFNYMVTEDGNLIYIDDEPIIKDAYNFNVASIIVLTNLMPDSGFSSEIMSTILNNEYIQDLLISNILDTVKYKGYYGVDADFEYIFPEDKEEYEQFLRKLTTVWHSEG